MLVFPSMLCNRWSVGVSIFYRPLMLLDSVHDCAAWLADIYLRAITAWNLVQNFCAAFNWYWVLWLTRSFLRVVLGLNLTLMSASSSILFIGSDRPCTYGSVIDAFGSFLGSSGFEVLLSPCCLRMKRCGYPLVCSFLERCDSSCVAALWTWVSWHENRVLGLNSGWILRFFLCPLTSLLSCLL